MANTKPLASQVRYGTGNNTVDKALKKSILSFNTLSEAQAAAATLPDGSSVIVEGSSQGYAVGSAYVPDSGTPAVRMQSYTSLRAYTGKAEAVDVTTPGIAGRFYRRGSGVDNGGTVIVDALGRSWQREVGENFNILWFGVKNDFSEDNAVQITAANEAAVSAKRALYWPTGNYLTSGIKSLPFQKWIGENSSTTIIKQAPGSTRGLIYHEGTKGSDFLWLQGFTFDGNSPELTSGNTLTIFGIRTTLIDLYVIKSPEVAVTTSWILEGVGYGDLTGAQGFFEHITIAESQKTGWYHAAPTDSYFNCIDFLNCGLKANNTYYAMHIASNGRFSNIHTSNGAHVSVVPAVGVRVESNGNNFTNCHFEGAYLPLDVLGAGNVFENCTYYAPRGEYCARVVGIGNKLSGTLGVTYFGGNPEYKGVLVSGSGNMIDVVDSGCALGAVGFAPGERDNVFRVSGYNQKVGGRPYVGAPHASDDVLINMGGPGGGKFIQDASSPWAPFSPVVTAASGTFTTVSSTGRVRKVRTTAFYELDVYIEVNGTAASAIRVALPFIAGATSIAVGREDVLGGKAVIGKVLVGTNQLIITDFNNVYPGGNFARIYVSGQVELA